MIFLGLHMNHLGRLEEDGRSWERSGEERRRREGQVEETKGKKRVEKVCIYRKGNNSSTRMLSQLLCAGFCKLDHGFVRPRPCVRI